MQDLGVLQELVSPDDAAGVYRKVAIHDLQKFGLPGLLIAIALGGGAGVPAVLGGTDAPLGTAIGIAALAAAVVIYVFQLLINTRLAEGEARAIENRVQMVLDLAGSITAAWMESRDKTLSRAEASAF